MWYVAAKTRHIYVHLELMSRYKVALRFLSDEKNVPFAKP